MILGLLIRFFFPNLYSFVDEGGKNDFFSFFFFLWLIWGWFPVDLRFFLLLKLSFNVFFLLWSPVCDFLSDAMGNQHQKKIQYFSSPPSLPILYSTSSLTHTHLKATWNFIVASKKNVSFLWDLDVFYSRLCHSFQFLSTQITFMFVLIFF